MLAEILNTFRQTGDPLNIDELAHRLGTEQSALEGMLEMLVRQGKLREISLGSEDCIHCNHRLNCTHLQAGNSMGKVYELSDSSR
jgi:predicted transcriptional regulator